MKLADFDFVLPGDLIAQHPVEPRDASRLLDVGATLVDRSVRDLTPYAELWTGADLRLLIEERADLLHLRVAMLRVDPKLRGVIASMIAECFTALYQTVFGGIAIRQADAIE